MNFISIILFFIKYGPMFFEFIMKAIELIRWLRKNDDEAKVRFASSESVKSELDGIAKRCKKSKDMSEIKDYIAGLEARKAEVIEKKKKAEADLAGL